MTPLQQTIVRTIQDVQDLLDSASTWAVQGKFDWPAHNGAPGEVLGLVDSAREQLEQVMLSAVSHARVEGYSWGQIAEHAHSTRQNLHQRYGSQIV